MAVTAYSLVRMHNLFAVVMMSGIYSLLAAVLYLVMDAVDVAFTEAAVGAGISTVLMLGTMSLTSRFETPSPRTSIVPFLVVCVTGAVLIYGTLDMPNFGAADAPVQTHVGPDYLSRSPHEIGVPNVVTAILASYRGYDTLGETAVVFTAGIGVLLLISGLRRRRRDGETDPDEDERGSA